MPLETEYQLEDVEATRIASDAIDGTFRSTTIGKLVKYPVVSNTKDKQLNAYQSHVYRSGVVC